MLKSDMRPGGTAVDTRVSMDSVSMDSGSSNDSLDHLTAEERACLMFLEETIEALEAEEDGDASSDEAEHRPGVTGSLAARVAHLSTVIGRSNKDDASKYPHTNSKREVNKDHKPFQSCLVPTPFALANRNPSVQPKPGTRTFQGKVASSNKPQVIASVHNSNQSHHNFPPEVNVVVIPHPTDFKEDPGRQNGRQESHRLDSALSRGPLSYEDLVQLRNSAYLKKATPSPASETRESSPAKNQPLDRSVPSPARPKPMNETIEPKANPPAVAPKPKPRSSNKAQSTADPSSNCSVNLLSSSPGEKIVMDPQRVRREALRKLGLLKTGEANIEPNAGTPQSPESSKPQLVRPGPDPPHIGATKGRPLFSTQGTQGPKIEPLFPSGVSHQHRTSSQSSMEIAPPARPIGVKSITLERSGMGLGAYMASQMSPEHDSSNGSHKKVGSPSRPRPASLGQTKDFDGIQPASTRTAGVKEAARATPTAAPRVPQKVPRSQGNSVLITPRNKTGEDHQEALRKLGLLKN